MEVEGEPEVKKRKKKTIKKKSRVPLRRHYHDEIEKQEGRKETKEKIVSVEGVTNK